MFDSPWYLSVKVVLTTFVLSGMVLPTAVQAQVNRFGDANVAQCDDPVGRRVQSESPNVAEKQGVVLALEPEEFPDQQDAVDQDAVKLRELGQKYFAEGSYHSMVATYAALTELPSAVMDDDMWLGHAHQLARNWPAAIHAYHRALDNLDAQIALTEIKLKDFEVDGLGNDLIRLQKGSKYPSLKRDQEQLPKQWPDLVLQIGLMELVELKDSAAAAKTLSQGLRFSPELRQPLDQLLVSAETASAGRKVDHQQAFRALGYIVPLETQRFLAVAQENLGETASAFDTWCRVRLCKITHAMSYGRTEPGHLQDLSSKLPADSLKPFHYYVLKHPDREPPKQRAAEGFLKTGVANPFQTTSLKGFDFTVSGPAAASITKLNDGRMLMAYTTGDQYQTRIKLSISQDGTEWEAPWEFSHNSIFNTRAPSLLLMTRAKSGCCVCPNG